MVGPDSSAATAPGEPVEGAGFAAGSGQHDPVDPSRMGVEPGVDGSGVNLGGGGGEGDVAMFGVRAEPGQGVAVAQLIEGVVFPVGQLPAVDGQLGDSVAVTVDGGAEHAAGIHLLELVVIADEDHLRPGPARRR